MIYTDKNHMTGDTMHELTEFAQRIGLSIGDMKSYGSHVHYVLNEYTSEIAIEMGAKIVTTAEIVELSEKINVI